MKSYLAVATIAFYASIVKAGQLISSYNLISPPPLVYPGTYSLGHAPQYYPDPSPSLSFPAHPKAVETSLEESVIPSELKKSDNFYSNPNVASALARESLNFNKETVIYDRPSEKINRQEIAKLINNLYRVHHENK
ncbi:uncharacterized protein LOC115889768 [Sitophilus oryzae]|uniref:Uncharacterized protein LOC115889768 n=1 Tax=Sitophilus oryzae TaxID=7048 RepID=A0A6J2YSE2_SITOR|nr:uncharacterized protein LOC115889768 [Sitophilus oryzae]